MVSKLILHLSEEDSTGVHIRLGQDAVVPVSICQNIQDPCRILFFASLLVRSSVQQPQDGNALHDTSCGVPKELASGFQRAVYPDVVLGSHEEVARLGRVVGRLFGDVVSSCPVRVVPVAGEDLSEDRVQRLLHTSAVG